MDHPLSRFVLVAVALSVGLTLGGCQGPTGGGTNVALLYGVSNYGTGSGVGSLTYPALDVEALNPLLSTTNGGLYSVVARTDSAATKATMKADIEAAAAVLGPESLFLFYFGGHGIQGTSGVLGTEGHASIAPYGVGTGSSFSPTNMVTEDELRSWLSVLPTKKIIVILDACFSGGFITMPQGADGVPQDAQAYYQALWKAFLTGQSPQAGLDTSEWFQSITSDHASSLASWTKALASGSGFAADQAQVLTAAGALEESYDDNRFNFQHGVFTYFLLEAREKGDFDGNGYVTVSEAYRHAFDGIQSRWNLVWGAVGEGGFSKATEFLFLPHLSAGPADYLLFKK